MLRKASLLAITLFVPMIAPALADTPKENNLPAKTKEFFVDVGDAKLFCRVMGEGSPVIILNGGPGMSQEYLMPYLSKLSNQHQVLMYDQRGSGESIGEINDDSITMQTYVDDLDKIRRAVGYKKVTLLGHSFGSLLAMNYAGQHPEFVEKLVLSNSMAATSEDFSKFLEEWGKRVAPHMEELKTMRESKSFISGDPEVHSKYVKLMFQSYMRDPKNAENLRVKFTTKSARDGFKVHELFGKNLFSKPYDINSQLANVKCPVLIIHGDSDPVPLATANHLNKQMTNSQLVVLRDCGHFAFVEQPDEFIKTVNKFLDKKSPLKR